MTSLPPEQAKTLGHLLQELHEKQTSYLSNLEAHISFRRHPKFTQRIKKNKIMMTSYESDEQLLNALRFGAQDILSGFGCCLETYAETDQIEQLAKTLSGVGMEIFLYGFSLATSRYEEMNAANSIKDVHKFFTKDLPELQQKLLKRAQGEMKGDQSGKPPLLTARSRSLLHIRSNSAHDLSTDTQPVFEISMQQLEAVARDQFSPFISTIQRAVQIRSFLERIILEALVPKSYRAFKDDCFELKRYSTIAQRCGETNPADQMARRIIGLQEDYKASSKEAESKISTVSDVAKNQAEGTKFNVLGEQLLQSKDYQKAVENFRKAIKHDPTQYVFHENSATALAAMLFYQEATIAFENAIRLRKMSDKSVDSYNELVKTISGDTKDQLTAQIKKLTVRYIEESKQKARRFEESSREMDEKMARLKSEYEAKLSHLSKMETDLSDRLADLAKSEKQVQELKAQLIAATAKGGGSEQEAMLKKEQAHLDELKKGADKQSAILEQEKQKAKEAQEKLGRAERENKMMQLELAAAKEAMAQFQEDQDREKIKSRTEDDEDSYEDELLAMDCGLKPCKRPVCIIAQRRLASLPPEPAPKSLPPKTHTIPEMAPEPVVAKTPSPPPHRATMGSSGSGSRGPKRNFLSDPDASTPSYVTPSDAR
eukprot:gb/GEZN01003269.1/.p1 GENE.gb/GEZN01003269.1/~~gb/GEZN01003269.1/.p1  ORF type:complete len:656 (+),score=149.38 gb/GEZN01003269.1/:45-2012(+)